MNEADRHHDTCLKILNDASEGKLEIVVSALVMVEVIRPKGAPVPLPPEDERKIRDFFENEYVKMRSVDRLIAEVARDLCWKYGLHPRDAIHLATAKDALCDCLETTDAKRLRVSENPDVGITIREPSWTSQLALPEQTE